MNLIEQSVEQISKENFRNYYNREQAEEELMDMLQSNHLFKMKGTTLDFIKKLTGQSGNSYTIRETGKFLSDLINELKIEEDKQYKVLKSIDKLDRLGIHYSWLMVLMAFVTTMFSSAVISTPQILILPITKAYGWNISDITSSIGVMFFVLASIAPFGGALILRFGIPKIVIISCSFATLGLASTVLVSEKWHLYISIGICLGIASGILGLGLSAAIATRWFNKRRGLVTGILTSAFAAGQLIFVPLMAWFTTIFNWQYVVIPVLIGSITCSILFLFFGKSESKH